VQTPVEQNPVAQEEPSAAFLATQDDCPLVQAVA